MSFPTFGLVSLGLHSPKLSEELGKACGVVHDRSEGRKVVLAGLNDACNHLLSLDHALGSHEGFQGPSKNMRVTMGRDM